MLEGQSGNLTFGVRPEYINFDDNASFRGEISAVEYLGTTQIVTLKTMAGTVKVRCSSLKKVKIGDNTGLSFDPRTVTIFNGSNGRALRSVSNNGLLSNG